MIIFNLNFFINLKFKYLVIKLFLKLPYSFYRKLQYLVLVINLAKLPQFVIQINIKNLLTLSNMSLLKEINSVSIHFQNPAILKFF